jgi:flavin reductase (DIM6/NTAB) family NADH-FMN oxidoreductase RutF
MNERCGKVNRKALHKLSYGLYVVTSRKSDDFNGQIANTVFQVSSEPATIAISINKQNLTHKFIRESKVFAVSVLPQSTPLKFIGHFGFKSGRDIDKLEGINHKVGRTGAPIVLDYAVACLEAEVIKEVDADTHTIFIGRVVDAEILTNEEPMTYAYYHLIKRGVTPKAAPTYIKGEKIRRLMK